MCLLTSFACPYRPEAQEIKGLMQHCSISSAIAMGILKFCTKPSKYNSDCMENMIMNIGLTHWGRVTHTCIGELTNIGSDNGLSPGRRQAIIWTNAGILLIGPLGTNFSEFLIASHTFSFNKIHLKMSSAQWRLFGLGLNELMWQNPPAPDLGCSYWVWNYQYTVKILH